MLKKDFKELLPDVLKEISIDTSSYFELSGIELIINQFKIIQVPSDFFKMVKADNLEYYKIFLSNAFKFKLNDKTGFLIFFKTEYIMGLDFNFETEGVILGWTHNNDVFYNFEYFDNVFEGDPNIKLIDINK